MGYVVFHPESLAAQLQDECLYATDIADYLVQKGEPFKTAHALVGKLIQLKDAKDVKIADLPDKELRKVHPALSQKALRSIINPKQSTTSKRSVKRSK